MYTTLVYTPQLLLGLSLIQCFLLAATDAQPATIRRSIATTICESMKGYSRTNQIVGILKMPSHVSEKVELKVDCKICRDVNWSFCNNCQKFTYIPCHDPHRRQKKTLSEKPPSATSATRIFYGREAYPNEFPFQIAFLYNNSQYCGGSIYNANWIITAAHCVSAVNDSNAHMYSIKAGAISIKLVEPNQQIVKLKSIKIHEDYHRRDVQNDIALIQVNPSFKFNIAVAPICLRSLDILSTSCEDEVDDVGAKARVSGWGAIESNDTFLPDILQTVEVQVISNKRCQDMIKPILHNVTEGNICALPASSAGGGVCFGDSGGPLFININEERFLVGVISGGNTSDCGGVQSPFFYSRITYFYNWIVANAI